MELKIAGKIHKIAATPSHDERLAVEESTGCFIFADAKDAVRWKGLEFGGRWKTWIIGPLADLPMIQWPRFNRFHQYKHEAEGAYVALRGAVEMAMVGAPILERPGAGSSPEARIGAVFPKSDPQGQGGPIGVIMMDECADHDFANHATYVLACVRAGNHDGPRLLSYNPPSAATVATVVGLNDRIDHIVLGWAPDGEDVRGFLNGFLDGAEPDEAIKPVRIDCMSGVITCFWSRLNGQQLLGHLEDPAMGLCDEGSVVGGGVMVMKDRHDLADRMAGPTAYAFMVNPGKWTGRWMGIPEENKPSAIIFSRDGAASFHPLLDCSMPGVASAAELGVASPMEALGDRATDLAGDAAQDVIDDLIGPYMPARCWRAENGG